MLRNVPPRLAVRVMRSSRAECRVDRAFLTGGSMAKDGMIGAHSSLDADPGWRPTLPVVEQNRSMMANPLPFATEPSP